MGGTSADDKPSTGDKPLAGTKRKASDDGTHEVRRVNREYQAFRNAVLEDDWKTLAHKVLLGDAPWAAFVNTPDNMGHLPLRWVTDEYDDTDDDVLVEYDSEGENCMLVLLAAGAKTTGNFLGHEFNNCVWQSYRSYAQFLRAEGKTLFIQLLHKALAVRDSGGGPLHIAAACGATDLCALLSAHGAPIDTARDRDGNTPLHAAVVSSLASPATLAVLIKCGASLALVERDGNTPLHCLALCERHDDLLERAEALLAARGAAAEALTMPNNYGRVPLVAALAAGREELAAAMIDAGASTSVTDADGTPLAELLVVHGGAKLLPRLLTAVVDDSHSQPAVDDNAAAAVLLVAISVGNAAAVRALLAARPCALASARDLTDKCVLECAIDGGCAAVVEAVLDGGADARRPLRGGASPLYVACARRAVDIAKLLMAHGAPRTDADTMFCGATPRQLCLAAFK